jgi:RHS repeat-associated protein
VKKIEGGQETVYVYNVLGQLVAEYSQQGPQGSGGTLYLTSDHLGSTRVVTDQGKAIKGRHDYLPFGEEIPASLGRMAIPGYGDTDGLRHKFTAKERDTESNLDYFGARYFSGAQGRWTTPDDIYNDTDPTNPASWNRYVYVLNNPMKNVDPNGEFTAEAAKWVQAQVSYAVNFYTNAAIDSGSPVAAAATSFTTGVIGDVINGVADAFRAGESLGTVLDSGTTGEKVAAAVEDGGRVGGLILMALPAAKAAVTNTVPPGVQAADLVNQIGNGPKRVKINDGNTAVDLSGKAHFEKSTQQTIPTPHAKDLVTNTNPKTGQSFQKPGPMRPATRADINKARTAAGHPIPRSRPAIVPDDERKRREREQP